MILFETPKSKEQHFYDMLNVLKEERKHTFISWGNKYLLFYHEELSDGIHCLLLAREETYTKPIEKEKNIEDIRDIT